MRAQRETILKAIERTVREIENPRHTTGLNERIMSESAGGTPWTIEMVQQQARIRLKVLRSMI